MGKGRTSPDERSEVSWEEKWHLTDSPWNCNKFPIIITNDAVAAMRNIDISDIMTRLSRLYRAKTRSWRMTVR